MSDSSSDLVAEQLPVDPDSASTPAAPKATASAASTSSVDVEDDPSALLGAFSPLFAGTGGIDSWLTDKTPAEVIERLERLDDQPLTKAQLNQLLVFSHEAGVSDGFFEYYWLTAPRHSYDVREVPDHNASFVGRAAIASLAQLRWGLRRFYMDALLYFGNVRSAYRSLRDLSEPELAGFFDACRVDDESLERRGSPLPLHDIPRDDRYLISEMACKSLAPADGAPKLRDILRQAYQEHIRAGGSTSVSVKQLLEQAQAEQSFQLEFTASEILSDTLDSMAELEAKIDGVAERFEIARNAALHNTKLYLSMVEDLDIYVATSMRTRKDFREMSHFCDEVFSDERLKQLNVRYFDPTMSAADGHEDKGLIECLMVNSAKVLIYSAGSGDSYGKDAEAAMALSQGKPVIVYCPDEDRRTFYRDVHPLARLIDFGTGVANGWMVASTAKEVAELLARILRNGMLYELEQSRPGYLRLKEQLTRSVVRLQTNDDLLRETFWNYYHRQPQSPLR